MLTEFLERILKEAKPSIYSVDGQEYSNRKLHLVEPPKEQLEKPDPLDIDTLTGLKDYLETNIDELEFNKLIALVHSHDSIALETELRGDYQERVRYLVARAFKNKFQFGHYYDVEDFIIALQTNFQQTDSMVNILRVVGNLKEEDTKGTADDGVTQKVVTKKGVSLAKDENLPNPVILKPYRTFLEIDQPESLFVLRMKDGPKCALFEADGGKWRLEAMLGIKEWLKDNISNEITIIA